MSVFTSVAEALAADVKQVQLFCWIGGVAVDCVDASTQHGVDQPIGTATMVIAAPVPSAVTPNASVLIQKGYPGAVRTTFKGRIPSYEQAIDQQGRWATISAVGWASVLDYRDHADLSFAGAISLKRIFQALCSRRGVPSYHGDDVLTVDGDIVQLGGVAEIDGGAVVIDRSISPLQWLTQKAKLFGYRVYDTPYGKVRLSRVSGLPTTPAAMSFEEGVNAYSFRDEVDTRDEVTYWEVLGATYIAAAGNTVAIRSIPASVPYAAELDPPGYRMDRQRDSDLVTTDLADACRNVFEVDYGAPSEISTWEVDGVPSLQPGDVVHVASDTCDVDADRWLMRIEQGVSDTNGYYATMTGWSGAGELLPAGNDCISTDIAGIWHVGDETLSYYADPTPDGSFLVNDGVADEFRTVVLTLWIPDDASSLTVTGLIHGSNTLHSEGATFSRFEVWQLTDPSIPEDAETNPMRKAGDGDLPVLHENEGADFAGDDSLWSDVVMPLSGSLKLGNAELRLIPGKSGTSDDYDDYEVKDLVFTVCGIGEPDLPDEM